MTTLTLKGDGFVGLSGGISVDDLWARSTSVYTNSTVSVIGAPGGNFVQYGTGFTSFDAHGYATAGTMTRFAIVVPGSATDEPIRAEWSDFSIGARAFERILKSENSDAFVDLFFGGDDVVHFNPGGGDVIGGKGNDSFFGAKGDDTQHGDEGHDVLRGGLGDDTLDGGAAADDLTGGADEDIFVYKLTSDSKKGAVDVIHDLNDADSIDVSEIDADTNIGGKQDFVLVADFSGTAGELTVTFQSAQHRTVIAGDTDGNGKADFIIYALGNHADFTNFILSP